MSKPRTNGWTSRAQRMARLFASGIAAMRSGPIHLDGGEKSTAGIRRARQGGSTYLPPPGGRFIYGTASENSRGCRPDAQCVLLA